MNIQHKDPDGLSARNWDIQSLPRLQDVIITLKMCWTLAFASWPASLPYTQAGLSSLRLCKLIKCQNGTELRAKSRSLNVLPTQIVSRITSIASPIYSSRFLSERPSDIGHVGRFPRHKRGNQMALKFHEQLSDMDWEFRVVLSVPNYTFQRVCQCNYHGTRGFWFFL